MHLGASTDIFVKTKHNYNRTIYNLSFSIIVQYYKFVLTKWFTITAYFVNVLSNSNNLKYRVKFVRGL